METLSRLYEIINSKYLGGKPDTIMRDMNIFALGRCIKDKKKPFLENNFESKVPIDGKQVVR